MKRSQLVERNRLHREFESQRPVAPLEPEILEQNSMPVNLGVTSRKLRFTRSSSRDNSAENGLGGKTSPVHEASYSTLQRVRSGEIALHLVDRELNRRAHGSHESSRSVVGASGRVLRSSEARVSSSVTFGKEDPKLEVYRDHSPGIVSSVEESSQDFVSPVLRKSTSSTTEKELQQGRGKEDRGKENRDPHCEAVGTSHRSPLPEWYTRKPLQDITNVLAAGLGDEQQPQPKKKLKKKVGSVTAPSFPTLSEIQTRRKVSTITQPKCSRVATPKQFSNLGKNFR